MENIIKEKLPTAKNKISEVYPAPQHGTILLYKIQEDYI